MGYGNVALIVDESKMKNGNKSLNTIGNMNKCINMMLLVQ